MDIGPIWRAMLRNKAGFILIALQMAVTLTILVNAFGIIQENSQRVRIQDEHVFWFRIRNRTFPAFQTRKVL